MKTNDFFAFSPNEIRLTGCYHVDRQYTEKHSHKLHTHKNELEILYVYNGEGRYHVGIREYAVSKGDIIICNADTMHGEALVFENTIETYCCAYSGIQFEGLPANCLISEDRRPVLHLSRYGSLIHSMMPEIHTAFALPEEKEMAAWLSLGILRMTLQEIELQKLSVCSDQTRKTDMLIRSVSEYIDRHYMEDLRISFLADHFHLSLSYLTHLFKRETGISPKQYIILRRIGEAQSLLETTDMPLRQIEEMLGFGSSVHFSAEFKKYVGLSPSAFRKGRSDEGRHS